jgi:transaldolase/glucose-6-phosphate isomerase
MIEGIGRAVSPGEALYIVSSKSGTTTKPLALLEYFWAAAQAAVGADAGQHFAAVTDPGTALQTLAEARGFRRVFSAPANVGGRYSALSVFGLLPAALLGVDVGALLAGAAEMARRCGPAVEAARNPGLHLGAFLALAAERGRTRLTFFADDALEPLEDWIEQLIAESSGKEGKGILPITAEPPGLAESYGRDRAFAYLRSAGKHDALVAALARAGHPVAVIDVHAGETGLGEEFFRWEFATAVACHRLGVNAFDQPDVQRAKDRTSELLKVYRRQGSLPTPSVLWQEQGVVLEGREGALPGLTAGDLASASAAILSQLHEGDALCFLAYLPADESTDAELRRLRAAIREGRRAASSHGFGPRYLHSTGQIHKGGPNDIVLVLLTADRSVGVGVPGMGVTFNLLQRAQAIGDLQALLSLGRRAFGFHFDSADRLPAWFDGFYAACAHTPHD